MGLRIHHPDPEAQPIDVPLEVEAQGAAAIDAFAAEQFSAQGLPWPPPSPPAPAAAVVPAHVPEE